MKKKKPKDVHDFHDQELINSFNEILGVNTDDYSMLNQQLFEEEDLMDEVLMVKSAPPKKTSKEKG